MRFKTSTIDVEVKKAKIGNKLLVREPKIVHRTEDGTLVEQVRVVEDKIYVWKGKPVACETKFIDPETEKEIPSSEVIEILKHYKYRMLAANGEIVDKEELYDYEVKEDGSEELCAPFESTKTIEIPDENWIPSTSMDSFLITNIYEIYGATKEDKRKLFEEAEQRLAKDLVGLTTFSFGGYKQYYAFVCPVIMEGKFVWLLKLTNTELEYRHLEDIPAKMKVPIKERPKLKTLPPVQALIVASKQRKK